MNPGKLTSRAALVEMFYRLCPSRACQRAIKDGNVCVLGGFSTIQPFGLPGWVCCIRSRHGRTWLLGLLADEIGHKFLCRVLDEVDRTKYLGKRGERGIYDGDQAHPDYERYLRGDLSSGHPADSGALSDLSERRTVK